MSNSILLAKVDTVFSSSGSNLQESPIKTTCDALVPKMMLSFSRIWVTPSFRSKCLTMSAAVPIEDLKITSLMVASEYIYVKAFIAKCQCWKLISQVFTQSPEKFSTLGSLAFNMPPLPAIVFIRTRDISIDSESLGEVDQSHARHWSLSYSFPNHF